MRDVQSTQEIVNQKHQQVFSQSSIEKFEYGDLILRYLTDLGVEYLFGVPGGAIEPLYNALARSERADGIRSVVACHETAAAFMADGYARESGKLGVCCATTGPGATNLITGIASGSADNIPMLVISGQTALPSFGRYGLQESSCTGINTVAMFEHCTRYNTLVSHVDQLERKLQVAIHHAFGPTPGPVHLSIPLDILRSPCEQSPCEQSPCEQSPCEQSPCEQSPGDQMADMQEKSSLKKQNHFFVPQHYRNQRPNEMDLDRLGEAILDKKDVVLVIGEGCDGTAHLILTLAQLKGWAVVSTPMAKGLVPSYHPCYCGVFGMAGHRYAQRVLSPAENNTVVLIGGNLDEISTAGWNENGVYSNRLIHIDDNPKHLAQSSIAQLQVYGSPRETFQALLDKCDQDILTINAKTLVDVERAFPVYLSKLEQRKCGGNNSLEEHLPIKPQYLIRELSRRCSPDTRVAADSGCSYLWTIHYWEFTPGNDHHKNLFRAGMGYSSMGWAIGASIGLAKANPADPVVCVTGDGSFLMSGQDLTTAFSENSNILFVILNDSSLGMVKHGQRLGNAEPIGYKLLPINFAEVAKAMGIEAHHLSNRAEFDNLNIDEILQTPGPCLLDIVIDGNEVPPMDFRMKVLGTKENI